MIEIVHLSNAATSIIKLTKVLTIMKGETCSDQDTQRDRDGYAEKR